MPSKSTADTTCALRRVVGPRSGRPHVYTDKTEVVVAAVKRLGWSAVHYTSTQDRPQTNGIAERVLMRVKESTSCALEQSGIHVQWWADAMPWCCFLWSTAPGDAHRATCRLCFGNVLHGPLYLFGTAVIYMPTSDEDSALTHKYHSN